MIYLLDANSFIQAKNFHYRMNVVPGFWTWLVQKHEKADIRSIDHVYSELTKETPTPDDLHNWSITNKHFFHDSKNTQTQQAYTEIANQVAQHSAYSQGEIARFLTGADPWLIAAARTIGAVIVTHEVMVPTNSTKADKQAHY
ncbi:DUF4411 family protein [Pseudidiomarina donghaiensis]|uniref:DUF4411 domain-containing protein n=1 Tax=Pseudidiomarina donghaiensis TaxID=519452 RepID=A0A432XI70_9GAMM|nr:DUF4411 family protein [Pseudidiomarina donghaiensis]RUO48428.1 DUF4411 domain-containing protein [Pseudidiomarina donghaiensis]SFV24146.1 protein of unknown function [Pseudidiomarina donghaiensis]